MKIRTKTSGFACWIMSESICYGFFCKCSHKDPFELIKNSIIATYYISKVKFQQLRLPIFLFHADCQERVSLSLICPLVLPRKEENTSLLRRFRKKLCGYSCSAHVE
jgi:hypothetical protein